METLYILNSNPLISAIPEIGGLYCTKEGHKVRILNYSGGEFGQETLIEYDIVQQTELNEGCLITELDSNLLKLFWKLMGYNSQRTIRHEDNTD